MQRPPLSVSIAGLDRAAERPWTAAGAGPRAMIDWAAAAGFRWIQLDGTLAGLRARELDRSARRDLAALLRRSELGFSGLDLWIPPEHLVDPARVDRAAEALLAAIELAADLSVLTGGGRAGLAVVLPESLPSSVAEPVASRAELAGVWIADHRWPRAGGGNTGSGAAGSDGAGAVPVGDGPIGVGIDPAAVLMGGGDPAAEAARAGAALAQARLSDASSVGRVAPGSRGGRLDELAYVVALATAGYDAPLVLDLRALADPDRAARDVLERWQDG